MFIQGFKPVISKSSRILILGSMPSEESLRKKQYYANPRNQFWRILYTLFVLEDRENQEEWGSLPGPNISYSEKLNLVLYHQLALWDVIEACEREGSLDTAIKSPRPNPFADLFSLYPDIRYVAFNGKKSFEVYQRQVGLELQKGLVYHVFPSTSPANTLAWKQKLKEWSLLLGWLR